MQIHCHSLTARSVPRQFREDLRKGKPDCAFDRNIRVHQKSTSGNAAESSIHIIYDSENKELVPYPDAEVIRTPSPEHVGIPAGPVKMPPIRSWKSQQKKSGSPVGYTSDDSCYSDCYEAKPTRRKILTKQSSNPSVKSLVEKYNV